MPSKRLRLQTNSFLFLISLAGAIVVGAGAVLNETGRALSWAGKALGRVGDRLTRIGLNASET